MTKEIVKRRDGVGSLYLTKWTLVSGQEIGHRY